MDAKTIKSLWLEVFPESDAVIGEVLGAEYAKLYLQRGGEVANGIRANDPLSYMVWPSATEFVESSAPHLTIKPREKYQAYSGVNMRRTTIKNPTPEKVKARFLKVKQFILDSRTEWYLDLSEKVES